MTSDSDSFRLRDLTFIVYAPTLLFGIGQGAAMPMIAITARELGASFSLASVIVALLGLGRIIGDVPSGWLVGRIGERRTLVVASAMTIAGALTCALATQVWLLAGGAFALGFAISAWGLARMAYVIDITPYALRGRALSTLGGMSRIGLFAGPFLGAAAIGLIGTSRGAYWIQAIAAIVAGVLMLRLPDVESDYVTGHGGGRGSLLRVLRENIAVLRTLGVSMVLVGAGRSSRMVVIPLWADHIGLDATTISVIFGIAGAMETLMFYPAGKLTDHKGRRAVAVPSMALLGIAHLVLPLTGGPLSMALVAAIVGTGNGIGAGLSMTLAADVAPQRDRATFIGYWKLAQDIGQAGGPVFIGAVGAVATAALAMISMGGLCLLAALSFVVWIPRFAPQPPDSPPVRDDDRGKADEVS